MATRTRVPSTSRTSQGTESRCRRAEAMNGAGQLTLTTHHVPAASAVEVQFTDSGHGIKDDDLDRIFSPFYTTKEVGHGTGLGLAISYGIVKEHKGTITVESQEGQGATFVIRLPVTSVTPGTLPTFEVKAKRWHILRKNP